MSGLVVIYNKTGVDPDCSRAAYEKIRNQMDDRSYRIEYFSEAPQAIYDNSVRLFVIPGGNYYEMENELKPLGPRIYDLVTKEGASYLGMCAGAIAACCSPLLYTEDKITKQIPRQYNQMHEFEAMPMHLNLYSGYSCYLDVPDSMLIGTQEVNKVSYGAEKKPFHLFFSRGVFFPGAREMPNTTPLLEYSGYRFKGVFGQKNDYWTPPQHFNNEAPVAAVTKKAGKGTLVLSGLHPELSAEDVQNFNGPSSQRSRGPG